VPCAEVFDPMSMKNADDARGTAARTSAQMACVPRQGTSTSHAINRRRPRRSRLHLHGINHMAFHLRAEKGTGVGPVPAAVQAMKRPGDLQHQKVRVRADAGGSGISSPKPASTGRVRPYFMTHGPTSAARHKRAGRRILRRCGTRSLTVRALSSSREAMNVWHRPPQQRRQHDHS